MSESLQSEQKRIVIAAGGTGGHLYPGIALAHELRGRGVEPVFVVRSGDAGRGILESEGFAYREIPMRGFPRGLSLRYLSFAWLLAKSIRAARRLLKDIGPSAVVGMGGYISYPVVGSARRMGLPTVIHEQNSLPGLANRVLSRGVDRIAVSFERSKRYFPRAKTTFTGNPVRRELFSVSREEACARLDLFPDRFTVLVFGGSQGAGRINRLTVETLRFLGYARERMQFLHLTGRRDCETVAAAYARSGFKAVVLPYLDTIGDAYAAADFIVCRAGATTLAELKILNKPALLVPFPHATGNHQELNAREYVNTGKGVLIRERDLSVENLAEILKSNLNYFTGNVSPMRIPGRYPQELLADIVLGGRED